MTLTSRSPGGTSRPSMARLVASGGAHEGLSVMSARMSGRVKWGRLDRLYRRQARGPCARECFVPGDGWSYVWAPPCRDGGGYSVTSGGTGGWELPDMLSVASSAPVVCAFLALRRSSYSCARERSEEHGAADAPFQRGETMK